MKRPIIAKFLLAFICAVAGIGVAATQAPPAGASSEVCVAGQNVAYWCAYVRGDGGRVDKVQAIGVPSIPNKFSNVGKLCDYRARVRISGNGNREYAVYEAQSRPNECAYARVTLEVPINRTFPKGFYVCTTYYIDKTVQQGREVCIKLT